MDLTPRFGLGIGNAWLMCIPFVLQAVYVMGFRQDVASRMSDMRGYSRREKLFTVVASIVPYPLMVLTVWAPFTRARALLIPGIVVYLVGVVGLFASVRTFAKTPPNRPLAEGIYGLSRNPLYVSAALTFLGICLATANVVLLAILIAMLVPQHFMILAEERVCRERFGDAYLEYAKKVPRYVAIR